MENDNTINDFEPNSRSEDDQPSTDERQSGDTSMEVITNEEEVKALNDKYLRLAAEFENYKRRNQREQRETARYANENLLRDLLPILDNLERAIESGKGGAGNHGLLQGVELTLKQFIETIGRFGVRQIDSTGTPFDPSCHQAVSRIESDEQETNTVVQEFQRGYWLHDRLLRAAMVAVAMRPGDAAPEAPSDTPGSVPTS